MRALGRRRRAHRRGLPRADELARACARARSRDRAATTQGREPILVGSLKACVPSSPTSRARSPIPHAPRLRRARRLRRAPRWAATSRSASSRTSTLRDRRPRRRSSSRRWSTPGSRSTTSCRTFALREAALARLPRPCFDRPYRRLVDDLPVRYVGFTVPDEFFVGYGFDLDERWRELPDLRLVRSARRGRPAKEI